MNHRHVSTNGETGRIDLPPRFDMMSSADFRVPFIRLLSDANTRKLVVDFSNLDYIDSMGIGTLMAWEKTCRQNDKALVIDKCPKHIAKVFRLAGVEQLFAFS